LLRLSVRATTTLGSDAVERRALECGAAQRTSSSRTTRCSRIRPLPRTSHSRSERDGGRKRSGLRKSKLCWPSSRSERPRGTAHGRALRWTAPACGARSGHHLRATGAAVGARQAIARGNADRVEAGDRRLAATNVYVTHDQREALTMSDRVAILKDGRLMQI